MSMNHGRWSVLALALGTTFLGACGSDPGTGPSGGGSPSPTPTPAPVTTVVTQGTYTGMQPRLLGYIPFTTTATGTIEVTIDWTFASNDVDLFLVRGTNPCTVAMFNDRTCPFLGTAESVTAKPERVRVQNLAAGAYSFYAVNFGTSNESIAYQVTLTSIPGASAASVSAPSRGGAKDRLDGASAIAMQ